MNVCGIPARQNQELVLQKGVFLITRLIMRVDNQLLYS